MGSTEKIRQLQHQAIADKKRIESLTKINRNIMQTAVERKTKLSVMKRALRISNKELAKHVYAIDGQGTKDVDNLVYFAKEKAQKEIESEADYG